MTEETPAVQPETIAENRQPETVPPEPETVPGRNPSKPESVAGNRLPMTVIGRLAARALWMGENLLLDSDFRAILLAIINEAERAGKTTAKKKREAQRENYRSFVIEKAEEALSWHGVGPLEGSLAERIEKLVERHEEKHSKLVDMLVTEREEAALRLQETVAQYRGNLDTCAASILELGAVKNDLEAKLGEALSQVAEWAGKYSERGATIAHLEKLIANGARKS